VCVVVIGYTALMIRGITVESGGGGGGKSQLNSFFYL